MHRTLAYLFSRHIVISIAAFLILVVAAPAQVRNRIRQNIGDTEPVMVSARHPLASAEFDQGRVEGSFANQPCFHGVQALACPAS